MTYGQSYGPYGPIGTVQRTTPVMVVLRGWNPNEPHPLTQALPVKNGVTIVSGQVIHEEYNGDTLQYEWALGGLDGTTPYFAQDDSTKEDVLASGNLVGLSSVGKFRLQISFYKDGDTYNAGVPLTYDGTTGNVKATTLGSGAPILGYVASGVRGPYSLAGVNSSATNLSVIALDTTFDVNHS